MLSIPQLNMRRGPSSPPQEKTEAKCRDADNLLKKSLSFGLLHPKRRWTPQQGYTSWKEETVLFSVV